MLDQTYSAVARLLVFKDKKICLNFETSPPIKIIHSLKSNKKQKAK